MVLYNVAQYFQPLELVVLAFAEAHVQQHSVGTLFFNGVDGRILKFVRHQAHSLRLHHDGAPAFFLQPPLHRFDDCRFPFVVYY